MKVQVLKMLKQSAVFFLLIGSINNLLYAQNSATPDTSFGMGTFNQGVNDIKKQSDGKFLIAGGFTYYKNTKANRLIRLNADKSIDYTFKIGSGADSTIKTIALQADGKIILGGYFNFFNGISAKCIVRLNSDGSIDNSFSTGPGANNIINTLTVQADGKIILGGSFTSFNGVAKNRIVRLNTDGSIDNTFNSGTGASGSVYCISLQADGKLLVSGSFSSFNGTTKRRIVRLNTDGSIDNTFNPIGASSDVSSIALQSDGKIVLGGEFGTFNNVSKNRIVRLNSDGTIDNTFNTGAGANRSISAITIQSNGKILLGGWFTSFNNLGGTSLVRLNTDGSIDTFFNTDLNTINPGVNAIVELSDGKILAGGDFYSFNSAMRNRIVMINADGTINDAFSSQGFNDYVNSIAVQDDGKVVLVGGFTTFNSKIYNRIIRLHEDGIIDTSFKVGSGANNTVSNVVIQSDGKIIVGGAFTSFNGSTQNRIVRLNIDGSIDNSFNPGTGVNNGSIEAIAIQSDGKILIGGNFTSYNGVSINMITRLNADGSLDNSFVGTGVNNVVYSIVAQTDGKILIAGNFTTYNGLTQNHIARLNLDGSIDGTFINTIGVDNPVYSIALQNDQKILLGGDFGSVQGINKHGIARLNPNGTVDNSFNIGSGTNAGTGVSKIITLPDGKILIGGGFKSFNGIAKTLILKLLPDGSVDDSFNNDWKIAASLDPITCMAIQRNGSIVVGGYFASYQNMVYNRVARINGDDGIVNSISHNGFLHSNNSQEFLVHVYPNPAQDILTVEIPEDGVYTELRIFSTTGVLQKTIQFNSMKQQVNIDGMNTGMYLYEIRQDEERKAGGMLQVK